jgi:hypothetical protein
MENTPEEKSTTEQSQPSTEEKKEEPKTEKPGAKEQKVTAFEVEAGAEGVDYDKLIDTFG